MLISSARHNIIKFRGNDSQETINDNSSQAAQKHHHHNKTDLTNAVGLGTGGAVLGGGINYRNFSNNILNPNIAKMASFNALAQNSQNHDGYIEIASNLKATVNNGNKFLKNFNESIKVFKDAAKEPAKKAETSLLTKTLEDIQKKLNFENVGNETVIGGSTKGDFDGLKGEFQYQAKGWLKNSETKNALYNSLAELNTAENSIPNELVDSIIKGIKDGDISKIVNEKTLQNKILRTRFINENPVLKTYKRIIKIEKPFEKGAELEKKMFSQAPEMIDDNKNLFASDETKLFKSLNEDVNKEVKKFLQEVHLKEKLPQVFNDPQNARIKVTLEQVINNANAKNGKYVEIIEKEAKSNADTIVKNALNSALLSDNVLNNYKNMDAGDLLRLSDESGIAKQFKSTEKKVVQQLEKAFLPKMLKEISMMQIIDSALIDQGLLQNDGKLGTLQNNNLNLFNQLLQGKSKKESIAEKLANITASVYEKFPDAIKASVKDQYADKNAAQNAAKAYFAELVVDRGKLAGELKTIKDPAKLVKTVSKHVTDFFENEAGLKLNQLGKDAAKHVNPVTVERIGAFYNAAISKAAKATDIKSQKLSKELAGPKNAYIDSQVNKAGHSELVSIMQKNSKAMSTLKACIIGAGFGLATAAGLMLKNCLSHKEQN